MIIKLEYVWLDGYEPEPNLRSKVKTFKTESTHQNSIQEFHQV